MNQPAGRTKHVSTVIGMVIYTMLFIGAAVEGYRWWLLAMHVIVGLALFCYIHGAACLYNILMVAIFVVIWYLMAAYYLWTCFQIPRYRTVDFKTAVLEKPWNPEHEDL